MGSASYVATRVLMTIPTVILLLTFIFFFVRVLPGDPVLLHFEKQAKPEAIESLRHQLGFDKPLLDQYLDYTFGIIRGDFGKSMEDFSPVSDQVLSAFPATLELSLFSMIIAVVVGVVLGVVASRSYNSSTDHLLRFFGVAVYATPIFFIGMILQMVFGIGLHMLPTGGRTYPGMEPYGLSLGGITIKTGLYTIDSILEGNPLKFILALQYLFLPSVTLGLYLSGIFLRLTRSNMLDTLFAEFTVAARARGIKAKTVLYSYALRNALLPIFTMMGLEFAALLGGAVLTETTFSWPGLGRYLVQRIAFRDYTAIQGAVVYFALVVSITSLVVDLAYSYLDPRIRV